MAPDANAPAPASTMPTMHHVVSTRELEKHYGPLRALGGVSLDVERASVFGLLGQNGAGKTTLIKILLGMLAPTSGSAHLLGLPVGSVEARREVGYLPEDHRLPEYHTGPSLLDVYGGLQGLPRQERQRRAAELLDRLGLAGREKLRIRGYSKGMKQRLGLAQALLHRPSVLFLDEPTDGVDPVGRKQIRDLLLAERARGVTIFINSHLLGEVEQLCDRVAILRKGQLAIVGTVAEVVGAKTTWLVAFDRPLTADHRWSSAQLAPAGSSGLWRLQLAAATGIDRFLEEARGHGLHLRHLEQERGTLEEIYLQLADAGGPSS